MRQLVEQLPLLPEAGAGGPPRVNAAVLAAFASVVTGRLGLGGLVRRGDALERRLRETMRLADAVDEDPRDFVLRLAAARPRSRLFAALADAVPNHESYFLRDAEQLEAIASWMERRARAGEGPMRVLSAGCANGEEVYSLAGLLQDRGLLSFEVWGVDVSPAALEVASAGCYPATVLRRGEGRDAHGWPDRFVQPDGDAGVQVRPPLRAAARFHLGNLLELPSLAGLGRFDVVLCRNVLLYFDAEHAHRACSNLQALVRPDGLLVLGRAEATVAPAAWRPDGGRGLALFLAPAEDAA